MTKLKYLSVYIVSMILYYFCFNNTDLLIANEGMFLIEANSSHSLEIHTLIVNNFIAYSTINLIGLSYIFILIDQSMDMKDYIGIRVKNINVFILKLIIKGTILITVAKICIDIVVTEFKSLNTVLEINISMFITILIYGFIYLLLFIIKMRRGNILLLIVFLHLVCGLLYYKFKLLSIFVYTPYEISDKFNIIILQKSVFLLILIGVIISSIKIIKREGFIGDRIKKYI